MSVVVDCEQRSAGGSRHMDIHSVGHARDVDSLNPFALSVSPVEPAKTVCMWLRE